MGELTVAIVVLPDLGEFKGVDLFPALGCHIGKPLQVILIERLSPPRRHHDELFWVLLNLAKWAHCLVGDDAQ